MAGARHSSATAGCGPAGDATGRGPEASAVPWELALAVAATLAPTRGALDERRRVGMDASALSTLAGARGGTVGATLRTWKQTVRPPPVGHATPRKTISYLKEEKARFLFVEVPADVGARPARPPPHPQPSPPRARALPLTRAPSPRARTPLWRVPPWLVPPPS
jgi:hypothetical protein